MGNSPDFSQTWLNKSSKTLKLRDWGCSTDAVLGTVITSPGEDLEGVHGTQSLSWQQSMSAIASGLTDGYVMWNSGNGHSFGVQIHVPLQMGPFGTAPYYQVRVDDGNWDGERTSEPHTFDGEILGLQVEVKSQAHHSNIYLEITVTDRE